MKEGERERRGGKKRRRRRWELGLGIGTLGGGSWDTRRRKGIGTPEGGRRDTRREGNRDKSCKTYFVRLVEFCKTYFHTLRNC